MIIQFSCDNGHYFEKDEIELIIEKQSNRYCWCGNKLHLKNLDNIVKLDIERRIKNNLNKWFVESGIEATIELLERNEKYPITKLYIEELKKRGLKV
jgi:hypothetical protein